MTRSFLKPLLESNELAYIIPEKPQSRFQSHIPYSPNVETIALLVKTDNYGKVEDTTAEKKNIDYRAEEIPDCGCICG